MPIAADVSKKLADLKSETIRRWRAWAESMADGGDPPPVLEVLEAGAILQVIEPMEALATDAQAIADVRDLEHRAEVVRERVRARLAKHGGSAGIRERIHELRAELRELEAMNGPENWSAAGSLAGQASRLRAANPRAFGPPVAAPITDKPARRRAAT